jgi:hypothetical protein
MRTIVWVLVVVLAIVHFDFWYWNDRTLLFGFLPVGLGFHAGFSLACGFVWLLAVKFAWPSEIEDWAEDGVSQGYDREPEVPVHQAAGIPGDPFASTTDEDSL